MSEEEKAKGTEEKLELCKKRLALGLECRRYFEDTAVLSLLFWAGRQWEALERDVTQTLRRSVVPESVIYRIRITDNRIHQLARQAIAIMVGSLPELVAVPATGELSDIEAAKLATKILRWRELEDDEEAIRDIELKWVLSTGECLRRTFWDPFRGDDGDVATETVNFFRYVKDPTNPDIWPPKWIIEYDARDVDWVKEVYGVTLEPEDVTDATHYLDKVALSVMSGREVSPAREAPKNHVVLYRMYCLPSEKFPQGRIFVWARDRLLHEADLQAGTFPFARATWSTIPGRLYPISFVELLVSDQRRRNILLSQIAHVVNAQTRGDIVGQGSGRPRMEVMEDGRKVIIMPPQGNWEFVQYGLNLRDAMELADRALIAMKEKAGVQDPTLGTGIEKRVTLGELQMLREADIGQLSYYVDTYGRTLARIGMHKIIMLREYAITERLIRGVGATGVAEVLAFRGADLRGAEDVICVPRPHLTPAMRYQARLRVLQAGLAGPYVDPADEFAKRLQLRFMGLDEVEREVERVYGPLEDCVQRASSFAMARSLLQIRQLQSALMQTQMGMAQLVGNPAQAGIDQFAPTTQPEMEERVPGWPEPSHGQTPGRYPVQPYTPPVEPEPTEAISEE